jgi:quinoprotein glucose dehydrogenase
LIEDTDGDGRADQATVFADRFNGILDGTAAGVLAQGGNVYLACIPHLWLLRDENGDSRAEVRRPLHSGYGVRFAFRGHDMHGLIVGPDGRLYFSIGDRGLNVKHEGKHFAYPEAGAVMRCELDGSNLEMFARGLRNPQELAFDDYGNLFTGDNNSDSGDKARWVHVVEGGDSGWRMAYQYLPDRGPFNREKIWHPYDFGAVGNALRGVPDQPAYIVPPITNFADGPSGLAYYPGTGLTDHFRGRFLLVDFRGGPANSGVRSFRLKPKGASFELVDAEETIWNVLATDVDFGPDGAIYLTDWVNGWNGEGKGRIYRFQPPEAAESEVVQEVKRLLTEGFSQRPVEELAGLLAHADRRIRQEAQFALVAKKATDALLHVAAKSDNELARVHAIWGLGQLVRRGDQPAAIDLLIPLLDDPEAEIRAQAANVLGDCRATSACDKLVALLQDESPRVRYYAAQGLGKIGQPSAIEALLLLLEENADADPVLRHAAVMGLVGSSGGSPDVLAAHAKHPSPAARMGVLLALRRLGSEQVALFLDDSDPRLVVEASRAIHDEPIAAALPQLASLITRSTQDDALLRRVLNANFRLGTPESAAAIAAFAARSDAPEAMRLEALDMLARWARPSNRDRVLGMWRPLDERPAADAAAALKANLAGVFTGPDKVRSTAAQVAAGLGISEVIPELRSLLNDKAQPPQSRAAALTALVSLKFEELEPAARQALADDQPAVRAAARRVLAELKTADAIPVLEQGVASGERLERQAALATLGSLKHPEAAVVLGKSLDQHLAGQFPADSVLDLVEAVRQHGDGPILQKLTEHEADRPQDDPVAAWLACLEGGDAERGQRLFFERSQLSCVRCHKIGETGGAVGPELTKIAADKEKQRQYLLESVVVPNKTIAKNFESVVILDIDGRTHTGILKQDDSRGVTLMTAEGQLVTIPADEIDARKPGKSSMPEDLTKDLTKFELRDLVEYLSTLK